MKLSVRITITDHDKKKVYKAQKIWNGRYFLRPKFFFAEFVNDLVEDLVDTVKI